MRKWILENALAEEEELTGIEEQARTFVNECRLNTWRMFEQPIQQQKKQALDLIQSVCRSIPSESLQQVYNELASNSIPFRRDVMTALQQTIVLAANPQISADVQLMYHALKDQNRKLYNTNLYVTAPQPGSHPLPDPGLHDRSPQVNGYEVLNRYFDKLFESNPAVVAFGEDLGKIGDVNQGFAGLQQKYGEHRIFDTGIRELTIMGQGVGMSMRGLRPIAEIQYLDYLLFGLQILSDDAASMHYRSAGKQIAPLIVRSRGHRLEGIWHSGSPMGILINALKGVHVCVPRNMLQAVGFYNTLLAGKDPGVVIESLNGYRLKERLPDDLLSYKVPLGIPEVVRSGSDITVVSYGSTLRIVLDAAELLSKTGVDIEVLDVQTLMPFDLNHDILASLKKTNRILFVDEDVPGGATSYMFAEVMDNQGGYKWLDASPRILCAQPHRPAYGSDGDYFSKPNMDDIVILVQEMMAE
jgi:pyruvate/2-oxoglutarate/acetoin dehydrogenase E1 component